MSQGHIGSKLMPSPSWMAHTLLPPFLTYKTYLGIYDRRLGTKRYTPLVSVVHATFKVRAAPKPSRLFWHLVLSRSPKFTMES